MFTIIAIWNEVSSKASAKGEGGGVVVGGGGVGEGGSVGASINQQIKAVYSISFNLKKLQENEQMTFCFLFAVVNLNGDKDHSNGCQIVVSTIV